jgi:hypothetical protein
MRMICARGTTRRGGLLTRAQTSGVLGASAVKGIEAALLIMQPSITGQPKELNPFLTNYARMLGCESFTIVHLSFYLDLSRVALSLTDICKAL